MASSIVISSDTFYESTDVDGSLDFSSNVTISIVGDATFNPTTAYNNAYITNVPAGWTKAISAGSVGTKELIISFSGDADNHEAVDSISNLGIYIPLDGTYTNSDGLDDWQKLDFNVVFYGSSAPVDPDPDPDPVVIVSSVTKFKTYILDLQCKHASLGEKISKGYHYGKVCKKRSSDFIQLSYMIDILSRHNVRLEELGIELDSTFDYYCLNNTELLTLVDYAYYIIKRY
jgi:hypothetical protein